MRARWEVILAVISVCAAWLRWQRMGDASMKINFVGDDCTLCMRPSWMCKSKGLM